MQFTNIPSVKGTQSFVETKIGIINVGCRVIISTPQGNKIATVLEISSKYVKTDYLFMKFDCVSLGLAEMDVYATIKIVGCV